MTAALSTYADRCRALERFGAPPLSRRSFARGQFPWDGRYDFSAARATRGSRRPSSTPQIDVTLSPCQLRLAKSAVFEPLPPITGPGKCVATDVVKVDAVLLAGKQQVAFSPPVTLRCLMAEAVAQWITNDAAPAIVALGTSLSSIEISIRSIAARAMV